MLYEVITEPADGHGPALDRYDIAILREPARLSRETGGSHGL